MERDAWTDLQSAVDAVEPGAELLTPVSERRFAIESVASDRIDVRFRDSGESRSLDREGFERLGDRLGDDALDVTTLQPAVEPYASILTLSPAVSVEGGVLVRGDGSEGDIGDGATPYLIPAAEARTPPERVHDDALLLADLLERVDAEAPGSLDTDALADLYVLCSDVQRGSDRLRRSARDQLLDRVGPDQRLHGRYGTVRRTTRERRRPKDDEVVFDVLDEHGVPREWVLGVDAEQLAVVASVTDVDPDAVFDVEESVYVQKTGVDEGEKGARLQGLLDRLDELDAAEEESIRADLTAIEDRIEAALSAG